jgi:hypothetical protein
MNLHACFRTLHTTNLETAADTTSLNELRPNYVSNNANIQAEMNHTRNDTNLCRGMTYLRLCSSTTLPDSLGVALLTEPTQHSTADWTDCSRSRGYPTPTTANTHTGNSAVTHRNQILHSNDAERLVVLLAFNPWSRISFHTKNLSLRPIINVG